MSSQLLDDVHTFLGRFLVYPSEHAQVANTLWIIHAHLADEWEHTPRLAFLAPFKGSGKTRGLKVTGLLTPRPIRGASLSTAYIFRKISDPAGYPTILFDEIDTVFGPKTKKDSEELRGLFNDGYERGGVVGRCAPNTFETQEFPVYSALAFAGIDNLRGVDTLMSRSVVIKMRKRKPNEHVEPYRQRLVEPEGHELRDKIAKWAVALKGIGDKWPEMPSGIEDRDADKWRPLLAVADAAGGHWPETARSAVVAFVAASQQDSGEGYNIRLLSDLLDLFTKRDADKLFTSSITEYLRTKAPWDTINRGGPIDALLLSRFLSKHNAYPKDLRIKDEVRKGYERASLVDAWESESLGESQHGQQGQQISLIPSKTSTSEALPPSTGKPQQGQQESLDQRVSVATVWVNGEQRSLADIIRENF